MPLSRYGLDTVLLFVLLMTHGVVTGKGEVPPTAHSADASYQVGELLFSDDFTHGIDRWVPELEKGGVVKTQGGKLLVDVSGGCTCWFKPLLAGPVMIQYDVTAIGTGGPNDRVSDLNCFWMARDPHAPGDRLPDAHRSGQFAGYNALCTYYVGLGGNGNTTTRFRRYVGDAEQRPLLPEHDLRDPKRLLIANVSQTLRLVACGSLIQFYRDGERLFELNDPAPYTSGWFALRTVSSHLEVENFRVYRLHAIVAPSATAAPGQNPGDPGEGQATDGHSKPPVPPAREHR